MPARGAQRRQGSRSERGAALRSALRAVLAACGLAAALPGAALAQGAPSPAAPPAASGAALPAELQARLAEIEQEIAKQAALAQQWTAQATEYDQARTDAPQRVAEIEREIATLRAADPPRAPAGASASQLESALLSADQELALSRREVADLEAEEAKRTERRRLLPELLAAARDRLRAQAQEPALSGEDPRLAEARQRLAQARQDATAREVEAYEKEIASYDARGALLEQRSDRAQLRASRDQARTTVLRDALTALQRSEAEHAAERARRLLEATASLDPSVRGVVEELAVRNTALAEQRTGADGLVVQIDDLGRKLSHAQESIAAVEADRARIQRKLETSGLSGSAGIMLRRQRAAAPDVGKYRRFIRMRQDLIGAAQERQLELREERRALADSDAALAEAMSHVDPDVSPAERKELESLLRDLIETKRKYLDALIADYETYFQHLVDFDALQQDLIAKTEDLLRFIDERILWIPSGAGLGRESFEDARAALEWVGTPRFWEQLGRALVDVATATPWVNALCILALVGYFALAPRVRKRIAALGEQAKSPVCASFEPTALALLLSLLLVPWIPGAVALVAWRVGSSPEATQFTRCIAGGALSAALLWTTLALVRQFLRPDGLATAHLGWDADASARLRRALGRLAWIALPAVAWIEIFEIRGEDAWKESVGRLVFALLFTAVAIATHRALRRPDGSVARIADAAAIRGWRWPLVHGIAVAVPALLAFGAVAGWYWTTLRLAYRYHWTLCFLFGLFVLLRLAYRWAALAQRRIALERVGVAFAQAAEGQPGRDAPDAAPDEEPLDLAAVDAQTSSLLQGLAVVAALLGLWGIWAEVLPAVGILRQVELWTTTQTVRVDTRDAAGVLRVATEQRVVPITLANALEAAIIALLALSLVRNLAGLLELSLFRMARIGAGERYAYATIAKYAVALGGVVLACDRIGIGWSSVQWLVAAVGLGLGFGLQEIFANFVSGVILLLERPIRVGDTVTIGDLSGTVSKIYTRATWITGGDRKVLIVPNKEFVTGRLLNWALTDTVLRLTLPVGVAYGSDVEQALALLRRAAEQNELVVKEPAPAASFLRFGESALELELSCMCPDAESMGPIRHALLLAIDRAFREAGIEIPFPQRDIRIRSVPS